ncbi:MAG TPA: DUF5996 family protein [Ramlibacter sp.]|nr:DUF5996 family protein [Ramlibacter sp.]
MPLPASHEAWPPLPLAEWQDTLAALHRWLQALGKLRLACTPWTNHSWHVTLALTARGLSTGPLPCAHRFFQVDMDFLAHRLLVQTSDDRSSAMPLQAQSVADFHRGLLDRLAAVGISVAFSPQPCEIADALPFDQDTQLRPYEADAAQRFWRVLLQADRVLRIFRARFVGKSSPVHFFWGSMDLAVTRFSGRGAPPHPGGIPRLADWIAREAYSHEVSSCGFWAGGGPIPYPAFYAYAYPEPAGFAQHPVQPAGAFYSAEMREFVLPYEVVRGAADPDAALLAFLQSSYEAAAIHGGWDRAALETELPPAVGSALRR